MDSGVENGKGEGRFLPFFHSFLLFVLSTEDDQQVASVAVPNRRKGGGEKRRKGKFIFSLPIPLHFPLPLLYILMYNAVYFVQDGIILNAKSFKGGQI